MGSQAIQAGLWGQRASDWADIQEGTVKAVFEYVLNLLELKAGDLLLDVGCGSAMFCGLAAAYGASVTGIDATPEFIEIARNRSPKVNFLVGELEDLPFADGTFDVVTGFNSFQFAASAKGGLAEAARVLKTGGRLAAVIWGNKEDCDSFSFMKAMGRLAPPSPPGGPGPFALSENRLLETLLEDLGLTIQSSSDVPVAFDYETSAIALKGLLSVGPVAGAITASGIEKVKEAVMDDMQRFIQPDGRVIFQNTFRTILAVK